MYEIIADTHTHTIACDHAYSTILENAEAAREKGLAAIAMTEHTHSLEGSPPSIHFWNLNAIPKVLSGVRIIKGAEVNIIDYDGALDLEEGILKMLELVIASLHSPVIMPKTKKEHTDVWLKIAENPLVDIMGHMGDGRYGFDHERVLTKIKETGKIIEINSHSFGTRPDSEINCKSIALLCKKLEIPVTVSSDAHHASHIGEFSNSLKLLSEIDFPEGLIINADKDRFFEAVKARRQYK